MLTSLITVKAAVAVAAAATVGGVATAAYTGTLPAPAQQVAHKMVGAPSPKPSHNPGTPQATPANTGAVGPDASGPAAFGLCTAYAHAKAHGTASQKAVAFRNLAAAAGGTAKIAAYCATVPHPGSSGSGHGTPTPAPSHPAGGPTSHPTGKPSSLPTSHPVGKHSSPPTSQ